ncbi:MAG TPA: hypothetical protein VJ508_03440, partial [Saprospiraceae bacterium]|nr:hypothetical protein [Saprospiraceae bacterium]
IFSDAFKMVFLVWFTISFLRTFKTNLGWLRGLGFMLLALGTFLLWRLVVVPSLAGLFTM